jgi:general secretion pathway protein C
VEALLRKYLWAIDLAIIALCAVFLARASASAVEASIVVPPPRPGGHLTRGQGPTVYSKDIVDILNRNIFCSTCPPIIPKEEVADNGTKAPEAPQKTSLPLALMGIMYSPGALGLRWSVAIIRDTEDKSMGAFGVGGKVHEATLTEIQETRIYLDNAGKTEFLDLLDAKNDSSQTPTPAPVAAGTPAPGGDALSQEMDRGIRKTGEHSYEIQRQTLESVLGNMNLLSRSARIVPEIKDGKSAGFRLYSVRPDGPFAKIGMQNGDVISSINGLEITSPEKALEVYAKLKSASHLSLGLERNGQKVTKDYSIR